MLSLLLPILSLSANIKSLSRHFSKSNKSYRVHVKPNKNIHASEVGFIVKQVVSKDNHKCGSPVVRTYFSKCPAHSTITMGLFSTSVKSSSFRLLDSVFTSDKMRVLHVSSIEIALYLLLSKLGLGTSTHVVFDTKNSSFNFKNMFQENTNLNLHCSISTRSAIEDETFHTGSKEDNLHNNILNDLKIQSSDNHTYFDDIDIHSKFVFQEAFDNQPRPSLFFENVLLLELLQVHDGVLRNTTNYALVKSREHGYNLLVFDLLYNMRLGLIEHAAIDAISDAKSFIDRVYNSNANSNKSESLSIRFISSLMERICSLSTSMLKISSFALSFTKTYCPSVSIKTVDEHVDVFRLALSNLLKGASDVTDSLRQVVNDVNMHISMSTTESANSFCLFKLNEKELLASFSQSISLRFELIEAIIKNTPSIDKIRSILSKLTQIVNYIDTSSHSMTSIYDKSAKLQHYSGSIESVSDRRLFDKLFGRPKL